MNADAPPGSTTPGKPPKPTPAPPRSSEEQEIIDFVARDAGREWAEAHAELILEQARFIGDLETPTPVAAAKPAQEAPRDQNDLRSQDSGAASDASKPSRIRWVENPDWGFLTIVGGVPPLSYLKRRKASPPPSGDG